MRALNQISRRTGTRFSFRFIPLAVLLFSGLAWSAPGADLESARKHFIAGLYTNCISECDQAIAEFEYQEEWRVLLVRALAATGQYERAGGAISNALDRYSWSVPLRLLGYEVLPYAGQTNRAAELLEQIGTIISSRNNVRSGDAASMVALGRAGLLLGADPRRILDNVYEPARKAAPDFRDVYLAMGELAMEKHDFDLASKQFTAGLKKFPDDPDMHYGLALAFQSGSRKQMLQHAAATLEGNTNHVGAMLLLADHLIAAEEYDEAEEMLGRALSVNPWYPEVWAYRAVLAHLHSDADGEKSAREKALKYWQTNPEVDHVIGRNLSQKYRFAEGAAYQRRSLAFNEDYVPAKAQLAQDLLRLGDEAEGWRLADEAHQHDEYDVTSFNLIKLKDKLGKFSTLTNEHFIVRMGTNEAPIYGEEVLALLNRARTNLVVKYGAELSRPTVVEIFPEQKDFGVRTFGIPDNPGFLGVCFGVVVTANSPASQSSHPANWQAVLWHEFTHVITLQMTKNKMPRWLSEGISVFEELEANPTWGQRMTAKYREMILGDEFVPMGELSSAFLAPKTPLHLQFAYYESALAVEFIVKNYGFDAVTNILHDLGEGKEINKSIAEHTAEMSKLEEDFAKFARERAESLAPALDFTKPEPKELRSPVWQAENPTNFWALQRKANDAILRREWSNAIPPLQELTEKFPNASGDDSAWLMLARVHRAAGNTNAERLALTNVVSRDADALDSFVRLAELSVPAKEWGMVYDNAQRALAVNPLVPLPHRYLAQAAEEQNKDSEAIRANRTLLLLDPPDPAQAHFRLARLLQKERAPDAKREVLKALEEAPRFRDAHKLLREIQKVSPSTNSTATAQ